MGLIRDTDYAPAHAHEGYTATVLDDGTDTSVWTAALVARVVGWRPACVCGWRSPAYWARADHPDPYGRPPADLDGDGGATWTQWDAHLDQAVPELAVYDAAETVVTARAELDHTVVAARTAGATWTQIAAAADMSRQAAHERWAHHGPTEPSDSGGAAE